MFLQDPCVQSGPRLHGSPLPRSSTHLPASQCASGSHSLSLVQLVAHAGAPDCTSPPRQKTDGYKPQSLASTRLVHAESLRTPFIVTHLCSAVQVILPELPRQLARSSHDMPRPPVCVVQSATVVQHSAPLSQQTPSQCPLVQRASS